MEDVVEPVFYIDMFGLKTVTNIQFVYIEKSFEKYVL